MLYWGYIVSIHNTVNYDIDLVMPPELRVKYCNAFINGYSYKEGDKVRFSLAYRCRLKGLKKKESLDPDGAYVRASQFVYSNESWVLCSLHDIDKYRRLLVDIIDPHDKTYLSDILLCEHPETFARYIPKARDPKECSFDQDSNDADQD